MKTVIETHNGIAVVRDDLIQGGSKMRFLSSIVQGIEQKEIVYASPFCGGAAVALSITCQRLGKDLTLFYAKRKELHERQRISIRYGARTHFVGPFGYMSHVFADARKYAQRNKAYLIQIGFDMPKAEALFVKDIQSIDMPCPDQVWCAAGSGLLAKCLGLALPNSEVLGVSTGLKKTKEQKKFPDNVRLIDSGYKLAQPCKVEAPFPCCPNYDRKAWEKCIQQRKGRRILFWNVMG